MPFTQPDYVISLTSLCSGKHQQNLHDAHYLQGLIFAVCAAPEIPLPEVWLGWAFKPSSKLENEQEVDEIAETLMNVLQEQLRAMRLEQFDFPMKSSQQVTEELSDKSPVSRYLQGLLLGHSQLEDCWQRCWYQMSKAEPQRLARCQRDLKHCLMMFSTFANVPLAVKQAQQKGNDKLISNLPGIYASLDKALKQYVELAGLLATFLPDQFETFEQDK